MFLATKQMPAPVSASAMRTVRVSASAKPPAQMVSTINRRWGVGALVAGLAAAQLNFFPAGPAVAEVYTPMPSIDLVSDAAAADVLVEVEDAEIPQLEVRMGALAADPNDNPEAVASAQRELEDIETQAASLAEEEAKGPTPAFSQKMGGLLNQITALKKNMRGISK